MVDIEEAKVLVGTGIGIGGSGRPQYIARALKDVTEIKSQSLRFIIWLYRPTLDERNYLIPMLVPSGLERIALN